MFAATIVYLVAQRSQTGLVSCGAFEQKARSADEVDEMSEVQTISHAIEAFGSLTIFLNQDISP